MLWLFLLILAVGFSDKSSGSDSPVSVQPPLVRPLTKSCSLTIISPSDCSSWSEVIAQPFFLPTDCSVPWSKVILDVTATESGTQFDRFGALWLGGLEILRTTTPEPTAAGIQWSIEKDVTVYSSYFLTPNLTAYLAIPNNVDGTYTGVIHITAVLTFYFADSDGGAFPPQSLPLVFPLTNASENSDPFSVMQVSAEQALSYSFQLPSAAVSSLENIYLDVLASAHGCEEFFYSNLPSDAASSYGFCGGGIYRELQVYIDGQLAAITIPFPVIYTGGINPLLWRPITGMMSFDIPSHRFDLTPFAGLFLDGQAHTISLTVLGNNIEGYWLLDAALLISSVDSPLHYSNGATKNIVQGSVTTYSDSGTVLLESREVKPKDKEITFYTTGSHSLLVTSVLKYSDGATREYSLTMAVNTTNTNTLVGDTTAITTQQSDVYVEAQLTGSPSEGIYREISSNRYPLYVEDYYAQDATTFDMQATVFYDLESLKQWQYLGEGSIGTVYSIGWTNRIASNATYNRTLDQTAVYDYNDTARDAFRIYSSVQPMSPAATAIHYREGEKTYARHMVGDGRLLTDLACYTVSADATDGLFRLNRTRDSGCTYPTGISFCGYDVCGSLSLTGVQQWAANFTNSSLEPATQSLAVVRMGSSKPTDVEKTVRPRRMPRASPQKY